jgi:hypothetical protein
MAGQQDIGVHVHSQVHKQAAKRLRTSQMLRSRGSLPRSLYPGEHKAEQQVCCNRVYVDHLLKYLITRTDNSRLMMC